MLYPLKKKSEIRNLNNSIYYFCCNNSHLLRIRTSNSIRTIAKGNITGFFAGTKPDYASLFDRKQHRIYSSTPMGAITKRLQLAKATLTPVISFACFQLNLNRTIPHTPGFIHSFAAQNYIQSNSFSAVSLPGRILRAAIVA